MAEAQFTLTAPNGTLYKVHAVNGITEQQFTDGKKFILSDSGITAVTTGEAIQFTWTSVLGMQSSVLSSVTGLDDERTCGHRAIQTIVLASSPRIGTIPAC